MRMFAGDYHTMEGGAIQALPGSLFLVCMQDRNKVEHISLYLYLPDDIWYDTGMPPMVRQAGWHRMMRNYVDGWAVLSRMQRIVRACTEAQLVLQEEIHRSRRRAVDADPSDSVVHTQALAQFRDIAERASGNITELTDDTIRRAFRAWADSVAASTRTDYEAVVAALGNALAEPTPHTGGDLETHLSDLASWVPNNNLAYLDTRELERILQIYDNVREAVRVESRQRDWQYSVLLQLGMPRRRARNAAQDRSLTEQLVGNHFETVVKYLERFYDFRKASVERVEQIITNTPRDGEGERQHLPTVENRLARNIRLGRRKKDA